MQSSHWKVIQNDWIADNLLQMTIEAEAEFPAYAPGQFFHIRVTDGTDHLLRRPISLCLAEPEQKRMTLVYRIAGKGTALLARKKSGERLDVVGPLGQGFPIHSADRHILLVGGGIGVPPLLELAKQLTEKQIRVTTIVGFQSAEQAILLEEFAHYGELLVVTNDGSMGQQGLVTDQISQILSAQQEPNEQIDRYYACGPSPMLAAVQRVMRGSVDGYLSLEERMGCGIGLCTGCVHRAVQSDGTIGYQKVCKEGPVFPAEEVVFHG